MNLRPHLDAAARFDAEYGNKLSNHLPMALVALSRLGADAARLDAFAAHYASRLHAAPPAQPWPAGEAWQSRFGDPQAWPIYRGLFNEWFDDEGAPAVLAQALPPLLRGVGAAAFHGLIRTASALAAGHSHELADALAYWACRWFSLGEPPSGGRLRDPATTLEQLARLAAERYAASADFTVLHLVTSAHALRLVLPWLDGDEAAAALGHYWLAYAAGHVASGLAEEPRRALAPAPLLPWPALVARAIASDDEHLIKLVDSCREQERAYAGTVWREAAARAAAGA